MFSGWGGCRCWHSSLPFRLFGLQAWCYIFAQSIHDVEKLPFFRSLFCQKVKSDYFLRVSPCLLRRYPQTKDDFVHSNQSTFVFEKPTQAHFQMTTAIFVYRKWRQPLLFIAERGSDEEDRSIDEERRAEELSSARTARLLARSTDGDLLLDRRRPRPPFGELVFSGLSSFCRQFERKSPFVSRAFYFVPGPVCFFEYVLSSMLYLLFCRVCSYRVCFVEYELSSITGRRIRCFAELSPGEYGRNDSENAFCRSLSRWF